MPQRVSLDRVQEDDIVREEFVTTGDHEGEQTLVPKRKHKFLGERNTGMTSFDLPTMPHWEREEMRKNAKHWITY